MSKELHDPSLQEALNQFRQDAHILGAEKANRLSLTECFPFPDWEIGEHILWMLDELENWDKSADKLMRWVSWIQGVLVSRGISSVEEGRVQNYKMLNGGKEPAA